MDNFRIDIISEGLETLKLGMKIAFEKGGSTAVAYRINPAGALVFGWHLSMNSGTPLPVGMDADAAAALAFSWLHEQNYGKQPDHDGDNEPGWRLYNEGWGHVDGDSYAIVAVCPAWAMHGK